MVYKYWRGISLFGYFVLGSFEIGLKEDPTQPMPYTRMAIQLRLIATGEGHVGRSYDSWIKLIFLTSNGRKETAKASKSAISILMASNVVVIVECRGLIMASTLTRLSALAAAMYMEQMDLICMKESALSVKKELPESDFGGLSKNEIIW
jgi:hypothetical protein